MSDHTDAYYKYRELEEKLHAYRTKNPAGTRGEDPIIQEAADVWWEMTQEERDILDSEPAHCWPDHAIMPFKGAEVGKNLFWLDGLERYVYIEGDRGPKMTIYPLINAGRRAVLKACLPEPTAVFLVSKFVDPSCSKMARYIGSMPSFYPFVSEPFLVFETPVGTKDILNKIKNDPHFFYGG